MCCITYPPQKMCHITHPLKKMCHISNLLKKNVTLHNPHKTYFVGHTSNFMKSDELSHKTLQRTRIIINSRQQNKHFCQSLSCTHTRILLYIPAHQWKECIRIWADKKNFKYYHHIHGVSDV